MNRLFWVAVLCLFLAACDQSTGVEPQTPLPVAYSSPAAAAATHIPALPTVTSTSESSATATQTPTRTPPPTATRRATQTLMSPPTRIPTSTLNLTPTIPPALDDTAVPVPVETITLDNVGRMEELARWGKGIPVDSSYWVFDARPKQSMSVIRYSPDGSILGVQTMIDKFLYNGRDFEEISYSNELWQQAFPVENQIEIREVDNQEQVWQDGVWISTLEKARNIYEYVISPDQTMIAAITGFIEVDIWEVETGDLLASFVPTPLPVAPPEASPCEGIISLDYSSDNQHLVFGCYHSGTIYVWDIAESTLLQTMNPYGATSDEVRFSPDGTKVAAIIGEYGTVQIWKVSDGTLLQTLAGSQIEYGGGGTNLIFSPDGETVVAGYSNGQVLVWRVSDGKLIKNLHPVAPSGMAVAFSPNSQFLAYSAFWDVHVRNIEEGSLSFTTSWTPDSAKLASIANNPRMRSGPSLLVEAIAFSSQGDSIIYFDDVGKFWWRFGDGLPPQRVDGEHLKEWDLPEVFTVSANSNLISYQQQDEFLLAYLEGKSTPVYRVNSLGSYCVSPNGQLLATEGEKGFFLWDARDGAFLRMLEIQRVLSSMCAFSPNGLWLATTSRDGVARLWGVRP